MYRSRYNYNSWSNPSWYRYPNYWNPYTYGYRDYEESSYYRYLHDLYYGRSRNYPYSWERDSEPNTYGGSGSPEPSEPPKPETREPEPKPEPPKEIIAKLLKVTDLDLMILENAEAHRTYRYDCIQEDRERDGKDMPPECVVRRGDSMKMAITFDRKYEKETNDLYIGFRIGKKPLESNGTKVVMQINEKGDGKFKPEEWGTNLLDIKDKTITLQIFIPCNCIVGEWNLVVTSRSFGKDKDGNETKVIDTYAHHTDVTILFNPWCKYDAVYTEEDKDEYVLNDTGFLYTGVSTSPWHKEWVFGQFSDEILECTLHLLRKGMNNNYKAMSNPVRVSRVLAAMINSQDEKGVLVGQWKAPYVGGTNPLTWIGSINILKQYNRTKKPVKYGQCWVYSGLLTTVCRAIGIPVRPVTNFDSAHDTDSSCTIDKFIDDEGTANFNGDSIWNFHVWNEAYMKRADLMPGYDGWQVIDATPQELSDGIYTCGPAPVAAIKKGRIDVGYDTPFIFSEVNADMVYWKRHDGAWKVERVVRDNIGNKISTKKPGKHTHDYEGRRYRQDITLDYKYAEGSAMEREAVKTASMLASTVHGHREELETKIKPLEMKIECEDQGALIGQNIDVEIEITNPGSFGRRISKATLRAYALMYTGYSNKVFLVADLGPQRVDPNPHKIYYKKTITFDDYYEHLLEDNYIRLNCSAYVEPMGNEAGQYLSEDFIMQLRKPVLDIEGSMKVTRKESSKFEIKLKNPLKIPLTECKVSVQSAGFENLNDMAVADVPANGEVSHTVTLRAVARGEHRLVFEFDTKEIINIPGMFDVTVV